MSKVVDNSDRESVERLSGDQRPDILTRIHNRNPHTNIERLLDDAAALIVELLAVVEAMRMHLAGLTPEGKKLMEAIWQVNVKARGR